MSAGRAAASPRRALMAGIIILTVATALIYLYTWDYGGQTQYSC